MYKAYKYQTFLFLYGLQNKARVLSLWKYDANLYVS